MQTHVRLYRLWQYRNHSHYKVLLKSLNLEESLKATTTTQTKRLSAAMSSCRPTCPQASRWIQTPACNGVDTRSRLRLLFHRKTPRRTKKKLIHRAVDSTVVHWFRNRRDTMGGEGHVTRAGQPIRGELLAWRRTGELQQCSSLFFPQEVAVYPREWYKAGAQLIEGSRCEWTGSTKLGFNK